MKTSYFEQVNFWAKELRLPLFWLIDPGHEIFKENTLVFYKNNVIYAYHLNDREIMASERGYRYFSNKLNVSDYKNQVAGLRNLTKRIIEDYSKLKADKLTFKELEEKAFELIGFLNIYSNIYSKTEPFALSKIETNEKKYRKLIKELGEIRFALRKEGEPLFYNLFGVFLKEIAKRFDLRVADLFFYKFDELAKLFSGQKVKKSTIKKRKSGYALICLKDRKILLTGKKFKKLYKNIVLLRPKTNYLTGQVAMTGKARGRARVILHNKRNIIREVANFKRGEILITEMTRPDTILACKKAAAIITDEGGITSHAAIISRELRIPCIIATKIATQILRTGNLVEVNADKGIINIIKK